MPVTVTAELGATGTSKPAYVEYNKTAPYPKKYLVEDQLGEEVIHVYNLKNHGPSDALETEVFILWPSFDDYGEPLLYLLGMEYDGSKATCDQPKNINPLYVKTIGSQGYEEALTRAMEEEELIGLDGSSSGFYYDSRYSSSRSQSGYSSSGSSDYGSRSSGSGYEQQGGQKNSYNYEFESSRNRDSEGNDGTSGSSFSWSSSSSSSSSRDSSSSGRVQEGISKTYGGGAAETRLGESDVKYQTYGQGGGRGSSGSGSFKSSYDYERSSSSSSFGRPSPETREESSSSSSSSFGSSSGSYLGSGSAGISGGWKLLDNGTYIRQYDTRTTARKDGSRGYGSQDSRGSYDSGWQTQPGGPQTRKHSSWSSSSSNSIDSGESSKNVGPSRGSSIGSSRGSSRGSYEATETRLSSGEGNSGNYNENTNTILDAARGPADYHGTMSKKELEKEVEARFFPLTTRRREIRSPTLVIKAVAPKDLPLLLTRKDRILIKLTEDPCHPHRQNRGSFSSSRSGAFGSSGSGRSTQLGGGSTIYEEGSYFDQESRGRQSSSSSRSKDVNNGGSNSLFASSGGSPSSKEGKWAWSAVTNNWEWNEASSSSGSEGRQQTSQNWNGKESRPGNQNSWSDGGESDSGWVMLPNGTRTRSYSSWSSSGSSSSSYGGQGRGSQVPGSQGTSRGSGSSDSGWTLLSNGTWVRKQSSWSSSRSESSYGGLGMNPTMQTKSSLVEQERRRVTTIRTPLVGIEQPDGTLVRKSSSWASWSASSSSNGGLDQAYLDKVQKDLQTRVRSNLGV